MFYHGKATWWFQLRIAWKTISIYVLDKNVINILKISDLTSKCLLSCQMDRRDKRDKTVIYSTFKIFTFKGGCNLQLA